MAGYNSTYPQERVEQEKQKQQAEAMTVYDSSVRPVGSKAAADTYEAEGTGYEEASAAGETCLHQLYRLANMSLYLHVTI